jgi:hypothetical protein
MYRIWGERPSGVAFSAVRIALALIFLVGVASPALADSPQLASIRRQLQSNHTRAMKIIAEIRQKAAEKERKLAEMREGQFCSGCGQTRSEILAKGEQFPHPFQRIIAATPEQLANAARQFDDEIKRLYSELQSLQRDSADLNRQAAKIQYDESVARFRAQQEEARRRNEEMRRASDARMAELKKSMDEWQSQLREAIASKDRERQAAIEADRLRLDQQRKEIDQQRQASAAAWAQWQQATLPRIEPLEEFKEMTQAARAVGVDAGVASKPSPQKVAETQRLQEMADMGLAAGPPSWDLDGLTVVADKVTSVWNRLIEVKTTGEKAIDSFDKLVKWPGVSRQRGLELVGQNALDTAVLGNRVLGELPNAVDALLAGNYQAAGRIQVRLDSAVAAYGSRTDRRAQEVAPPYAAFRATQNFRQALDNLEQPIKPPANAVQRLQQYTNAGRSAFNEALKAGLLDPKSTLPEPKRWGPATEIGPLGPDIAKTFRSSSYTEFRTGEPVLLYRVYGGTAGKFGSYWTRTPPHGPTQALLDGAIRPEWGNDGTKVVRIIVPPGTTLYEGVAAEQGSMFGGGNQVFLKSVDESWELK